jgi:4a-hydroxytetrahydrobiopterin dehydratase
VYNRITIELTTHDAGGITKNDVSLAKILNSLE